MPDFNILLYFIVICRLWYFQPVMQEVMKYISPLYWDAVNYLIKELDLELVGVTKL